MSERLTFQKSIMFDYAYIPALIQLKLSNNIQHRYRKGILKHKLNQL